MKRRLLIALPMAAWFAVAGCKTLETVSKVGASVGVAAGVISPDQAQSVSRTAAAAGQAFESITPEQEYYIGRAVCASILSQYAPYDNAEANRYVNVLGQALAMASDKPETFGGYHFLIMDTPEVNAFAAPGGLILVHDFILRDTKDSPLFPALFSLNMLVNTEAGRSYSEAEIREMLFTAGIKEIKRLPFAGPTESGIIRGIR